MMDLPKKEKIKLAEINPHLTCHLCKGYYIDATTISECLHSFCRSCIIKFLHEHSYCPICEVIINKAKPNLKLDKTLQDIVYKLVPELFLDEMKRRQRFYLERPEVASKVTPEERGADTERTIFNPRDTISLSIEYISDDSTPGALLIPQLIGKGADMNNKNRQEGEESSAIKRFLQCPGMCRVEVLKKFIRNKYNVDTGKYYIDILYKRVPLPDHYTLIDIAYIYSWKRNEPMKFFFKITDINLVTDNFDYLIPPQIEEEKLKLSKKRVKAEPSPEVAKHEDVAKNNKEKNLEIKRPNSIVVKRESKNVDADKDQEYTNITLDRSNNVEIITKIQRVSNNFGLPIGLKITKQTVKKSLPKFDGLKQEEPLKKPTEITETSKPVVTHLKIPSVKSSPPQPSSTPPKVSSPKSIPAPKPTTPKLTTPPPKVSPKPEAHATLDIDQEKSNFLKSIELTARNAIQSMNAPKVLVPIVRKPDLTERLNLLKAKPGAKRKNPSPIKAEKAAKRKKESPKSVRNPTVLQMMSNVKQNASKIAEQMTPPNSSSSTDLQALLFDSYKINIPASLSVTVKNENDEPSPSPFQKPVQNYIEILKIPDRPTTPAKPQKDAPDKGSEIVETKRENGQRNGEEKPKETDQGATKPPLPPRPKSASPPYAAKPATPATTKENLVKLNPRTPQTFQKMFEETIKNPEFTSRFQLTPPSPPKPKSAQSAETPSGSSKRNILEIASKLFKKTKMEQEKQEKDVKPLNVPRVKSKPDKGNPPLKDFNSYISSKPQQTTSLHSPTLGLNYTVSVTQAAKPPEVKGNKSPSKNPSSPRNETPLKYPSPKVSAFPKETASPPKTKSPKRPTSSQGENGQPLSPNQLLEKYNIQNLAQLTANFNFPTNLCLNPANQLAAMHQAMIYRHFEIQNHQNWLNMNSAPLMQYEKYLQNLSKS